MKNNKLKKGGTGTLLKIAFRNIWRNKRRTVFSLSSAGISVFIFIVLMSFDDGQTKCIYDTVQIYEEGHVKIVSAQYEAENGYLPVQYPVSGGKNWKELAASIYTISGVRAVLPRISSIATLQESTIKHAILWGLDIQAEMHANHFNLADRNSDLKEGHWPESGANECAIGVIFAKKSGLSIGDSILLKTVSAQYSDKMWNPVITGIFNFDFSKYDEQYIIVDFERLQRLLVLEDGTQSLMIFADDEKQSPFIAASVKNILGQDNVVIDWNESPLVAAIKVNKFLYIIAYLVFLIVTSFLIINTMVMIINERIKETGMMGCLGMTRAEIVTVFFFESVFLVALGAFSGVIAGGTLSGILTNFPFRMNDAYGNTYSGVPVSNTIFFQFSISRMAQAWLMGVVVCSIFTLVPTLKSAFVEPIEALRR
ncbi:MAG: FtsX-like permease family protein [Treponema sp.]|nr:FtsX-like permease family protein [Treponema sp.]